MDIPKISFSINGDPTRGYKNVAFRGLVNYRGQAYLRPNPDLTDGGDTYICYITDKSYILHIVTSPSRVGGMESRGAFNVGVAIPKGFEIKNRDSGMPVSISGLARALRERFAEIAMIPNSNGRYLYNMRSKSTDTLNESLADWIDNEYELTGVRRKEIVMKGDPAPERGSRADVRFPTVEKIDQFFDDPNFSELRKYGSVEVVCSNTPGTLKLDVPRKKHYDLTLKYFKNGEEVLSENYPSFFASENEMITLPIGKDISIDDYEEFKPTEGSKTSLEQLKEIRDSSISIDDIEEAVTISVNIVNRTYEIEIKCNAQDSKGSTINLTQDDKNKIINKISFESDSRKRSIEYDQAKEKVVLVLTGEEIKKKWKPVVEENDTWKLSKSTSKSYTFDVASNQNRIELLLVKQKSNYNNGMSRMVQGNQASSYSVEIAVISRTQLPSGSSVTLKISSTGQTEKIPIELDTLKSQYTYKGIESIDQEFKDADCDIYVNDKFIKENRFYTDRGDPTEHITIKLDSDIGKYLKLIITIFVLIAVGFLIGALTQRFCNLPFHNKEFDKMTHKIDSLNQEIESLNDAMEAMITKTDNPSSEEEVSLPPSEPEQPTPQVQNTTPSSTIGNQPRTEPYKVRNTILGELRQIDTANQGSTGIATQAKTIVANHINDSNLDWNSQKWFKDNILNSIDNPAIAGTVKKIQRGWNPF